jgi:hypothetical protein
MYPIKYEIVTVQSYKHKYNYKLFSTVYNSVVKITRQCLNHFIKIPL